MSDQASIPPGYHGRFLHVDLAAATGRFISIAEETLRKYIGGAGLGARLLLDLGAAKTDPLSPASPLAIVFSPLVGSPLTTSAKFAVVSKSPLTERINDSLASSHFAIAGKKCGCDAIVITGKARELSVLVIDDGSVSVEPVEELKNAACGFAQQQLKQRYGPEFHFAVIGPAGENKVRYATISHDGRHAGRGGSGAVLGAKNIKAIAVRGTQRVGWAEAEGLVDYAKRLSERSFGPATAKYRELGTATNLLVFNRLHTLPTRNFQAGSLDGVEALSPEALTQTREKTRTSCAACTIGCEHIYSLSRDENSAPGGAETSAGVRLEYENLFALGPLCGITDADVVLQASQRCDELGLDTISAGGTIAFAMECVERGMLDEPWLQFGDGQALLSAIDLIGRREGLGDALAEGSRRLAQTIGQGSIDFAPQVKGLEIPGYEPRALQTMALGFAVGTRGADHNRSGAYEVDFSDRVDRRNATDDAARYAVETEDKAAIMDSLILCKFLRGVFEDFFAESATMLQLVTGWDVSSDELRQTAQRIVTTKKQFNVRAGWTPEEDTLPSRMLRAPLADDRQATLSAERLGELVTAYNELRGWSPAGFPRETST